MKLKYIFEILFISIYTLSFCQANESEADKLMSHKSYQQAIPIYLNLFNSLPSSELSNKISTCYERIGDYKNALAYQEIYNEMNDNKFDEVRYLNLLIANGDYDKASRYLDNKPKNKQLNEYKSIIDSIESLNKKPEDLITEFKRLDFNSEWDDFGIIRYRNNQYLICSNRNYGEEKNNNNVQIYRLDRSSVYGSNKSYTPLTDKYKNINYGPAFYDYKSMKLYITINNSKNYKAKGNDDDISNLKIIIANIDTGLNIKDVEEFKYNNELYSVAHPCLSNDGKYLFFISDMPGGIGGTDIYVCSFDKLTSSWNKPKLLPSYINTKGNEMFPYISPKGSLIFSSNGHIGLGGFDLYSVNIDDIDRNKYSNIQNLGKGFNSYQDDINILYTDYKENDGFLVSNRSFQTRDDIYSFHSVVPEPEVVEKPMRIYVLDKSTSLPLSGAIVRMITTEDTINGLTNDMGYTELLINPEDKYIVKVSRDGYLSNSFDDIDNTKDKYTVRLDKKEINKIIAVDNIYYEFDKYELHSSAFNELEKLTTMLLENPDISIELSSHTDSRGNDDYNMTLSQRRAESVVNFLISRGVQPSRMIARGYGEVNLKNHCYNNSVCTESQHAQNRRTEFKITSIINGEVLQSKENVDKLLEVVRNIDDLNYVNNQLSNSIYTTTPREVISNNYKTVSTEYDMFSVQIANVGYPVSLNEYRDLNNARFIENENRFLLVCGNFSSLSDAENYKNKISNRYKGCFVIKVVNNKRVLLN